MYSSKGLLATGIKSAAEVVSPICRPRFSCAIEWKVPTYPRPNFHAVLDFLPVAAYCTDDSGLLTYFNSAAAVFSGRVPRLGIDRWCVTWRLFRTDGSPLLHDECPMAVALKEERCVWGEEAVAERPDGTRRRFTPRQCAMRAEK